VIAPSVGTSHLGHQFRTHAPQQEGRFRGRDASYLAPPAQIRACGFPAHGSHLGYRRRCVAVCKPTPVSRLSGTESSACLIGPHSPWSLPFAPPTPQRIAPRCSSASQLSGRRRRPVKGLPPSATQTERAVFPHSAFMNGLAKSGEKGSVRHYLVHQRVDLLLLTFERQMIG
jgi:hypothetical protein